MKSANSELDTDESRNVSSQMRRRRFIAWGVVGLAALSAPLRACAKFLQDATSPDVQSGDKTQARVSFAGYPAPTYLPPGYAFFMEDLERPDGFTPTSQQSALVYRGPVLSENGLTFPIMIFVAQLSGGRFGGTEGQTGELYPLAFQDGQISAATYFDGMWELPRLMAAEQLATTPQLPVWRRTNVHALVFQWHGLQVGIRASRQCGVTFDELIKVAASLSSQRST